MLIADSFLGHRADPAIADRLDSSDPLHVVLSDTDRRRSRVRTTTDDGRDLGIVIARDLADGDVLKSEDGTLVVVGLAPIEALVLDFTETDVPATMALQLGHAVGNRHWDLAVRGSEVLFPATDSHERMESAVENLLPEDVTPFYEAVSPTTFDDASPDHNHGDSNHPHMSPPINGSHTHSHDDGQAYSHDHAGVTRTADEEE